ncbi:hypothetical protein SDC9_200690 [bioreactor metagenome]|uniref:Uncharacterized protein n=1 Tax=bioreactor metagenome TaxID=1076179 RepID=A0A645IP61_9ZZZZ
MVLIEKATETFLASSVDASFKLSISSFGTVIPDTSLFKNTAFLYPATGIIPASITVSGYSRLAWRIFFIAVSVNIGWVIKNFAPASSFLPMRTSSPEKLVAFTFIAAPRQKGFDSNISLFSSEMYFNNS